MLPINHNEMTEIVSDKIMTTKEASKYLSLTATTLKKYRHKGIGPNYLKIEGAVRYKLSDIVHYIHSKAQGTTSVQHKAFLCVLGTNKKLLNSIKEVINKADKYKEITPNATLLNQYLDKSNVESLKWSFDNLTLNFEVDDQVGIEYEKVAESLVNSGLVIEEPSSKHYSFRNRLYSSESDCRRGKRGIAILHNDLTKGFNYTFQLRLNPCHFNTKKKVNKLNKLLGTLFGDGYKEILKGAWVKRLDICFDMPNFSHDCIIFRFKSTRKRTVVRTEGKDSTDYICEGSRRRKRAKSYRKNKGTRIEFEFYPDSKKLQFKDILDYEMPFKRFELYSPDLLLEVGIHPHTTYALNTLGIKKTVSSLTCKKEKRLLRKMLKNNLLMTEPEQFTGIARKCIRKFTNKLLKG
jgi:hypothetical protein